PGTSNPWQYIGVVKTEYKRSLYEGLNSLITLSREIPPPGVMYEFVTLESKVKNVNDPEKNIEGKTVYQFEVFSKNMVGRKFLNRRTTNNSINVNDHKSVNVTIKSFTSRIGGLKKTIQ